MIKANVRQASFLTHCQENPTSSGTVKNCPGIATLPWYLQCSFVSPGLRPSKTCGAAQTPRAVCAARQHRHRGCCSTGSPSSHVCHTLVCKRLNKSISLGSKILLCKVPGLVCGHQQKEAAWHRALGGLLRPLLRAERPHTRFVSPPTAGAREQLPSTPSALLGKLLLIAVRHGRAQEPANPAPAPAAHSSPESSPCSHSHRAWMRAAALLHRLEHPCGCGTESDGKKRG